MYCEEENMQHEQTPTQGGGGFLPKEDIRCLQSNSLYFH